MIYSFLILQIASVSCAKLSIGQNQPETQATSTPKSIDNVYLSISEESINDQLKFTIKKFLLEWEQQKGITETRFAEDVFEISMADLQDVMRKAVAEALENMETDSSIPAPN